MEESVYQEHVLDNGIRVLHKKVSSTRIAHCGFILDIGARDEDDDQLGLAHFWEHMAFKGTQKRKAFHIINRLESVGGDLNAYTTKEKIYFYSSVLDQHYEKAVDLLCDITFQSVFPEKEIVREQKVILEEMAMYQDAPEDLIFDEFDEVVFGDHPLGKNILGTEESVKSYKKPDFERFLGDRFDASKIIFSTVGNIPFEKVIKLANKYLGHLPTYKSTHRRRPAGKVLIQNLEVKKDISQAHYMLGGEAYALHDKNRLPFFMLNQLLGGGLMSSRLNLALRERLGYVYNVESNYHAFSDVGFFGVYFGTEKKNLNKSIKVVHKEMQKLKEVPLGKVQLNTLKEQFKAQLAMGEESNLTLMQVMGKSMLDLGRIQGINEIFKKIDAVDSKWLQDIANEIYDIDKLSSLTYLPSKK